MRQAIDETERRREKQITYNQKHGIVPQALNKSVIDIMDIGQPYQKKKVKKAAQAAEPNDAYDALMSPTDIMAEISRLEDQMFEQAKALEFEKAAATRDLVHQLQQKMISSS